MTRIIALLNLKAGRGAEDYEAWARTTDLPTVNALKSIGGFELFRCSGTLDGSAPPYQYIEIIDVADMALFGTETQTETMVRIAGEFADWADPVFILTEPVSA